MNRAEILERTLSIIKQFCKNEDGLQKVTEQSDFLEDLGVNSARLVDIVLDIEDAFHIEIDDKSADNICTVGDAVNLIESKLAKA